MEAAAEANRQHPAHQMTVQDQYLDLFWYLAEGAPEGTDSVLTLWEMENGKPDLKDTIAARKVLYTARLVQLEGRTNLDTVLERYIAAREEDTTPTEDMKPVPWQGSRFCISKRDSFRLFWTTLTMARAIC